MTAAGIVGVLDFTSLQLKPRCETKDGQAERSCFVGNISIGLELANLCYLVRFSGAGSGAPGSSPPSGSNF